MSHCCCRQAVTKVPRRAVGGERWAELLTAIWKQAPVSVLEKARDTMLGMQRKLVGVRSTSKQCKTT